MVSCYGRCPKNGNFRQISKNWATEFLGDSCPDTLGSSYLAQRNIKMKITSSYWRNWNQEKTACQLCRPFFQQDMKMFGSRDHWQVGMGRKGRHRRSFLRCFLKTTSNIHSSNKLQVKDAIIVHSSEKEHGGWRYPAEGVYSTVYKHWGPTTATSSPVLLQVTRSDLSWPQTVIFPKSGWKICQCMAGSRADIFWCH